MIHMARHLRDVCRRLLGETKGIAALELTIVAAVLATAAIAVVDLGNAAQQQIRLQQALWAGSQYAISFPGDSSLTTDAKNAVTAALPTNWPQITVGTPTLSCTCISSSLTPPACTSGSCTSGGTPESFITLTASSRYTGTFLNTTISAQYVARYK
jgi:Flp pilus assembly protein TadG